MIIQIRTKDSLDELLRHGNSPSWIIAENKLTQIKTVEVYSFDCKRVLIGAFNLLKSTVLENGRVIVAFDKAIIRECDFKWVGQNPIKYTSENKTISTTKDNKVLSITEYYSEYINCFKLNALNFQFDEKCIRQLNEIHFKELQSDINYLFFNFDNSDEAIDDRGGELTFSIMLDIRNSSILPSNYKSYLNDEYDNQIYFSSNEVGIWGTYSSNKSFDGCFNVSSINNPNWILYFHGDSLEDIDGEINQELKTKIRNVINPTSLYKLINDAFKTIM